MNVNYVETPPKEASKKYFSRMNKFQFEIKTEEKEGSLSFKRSALKGKKITQRKLKEITFIRTKTVPKHKNQSQDTSETSSPFNYSFYKFTPNCQDGLKTPPQSAYNESKGENIYSSPFFTKRLTPNKITEQHESKSKWFQPFKKNQEFQQYSNEENDKSILIPSLKREEKNFQKISSIVYPSFPIYGSETNSQRISQIEIEKNEKQSHKNSTNTKKYKKEILKPSVLDTSNTPPCNNSPSPRKGQIINAIKTTPSSNSISIQVGIKRPQIRNTSSHIIDNQISSHSSQENLMFQAPKINPKILALRKKLKNKKKISLFDSASLHSNSPKDLSPQNTIHVSNIQSLFQSKVISTVSSNSKISTLQDTNLTNSNVKISSTKESTPTPIKLFKRIPSLNLTLPFEITKNCSQQELPQQKENLNIQVEKVERNPYPLFLLRRANSLALNNPKIRILHGQKLKFNYGSRNNHNVIKDLKNQYNCLPCYKKKNLLLNNQTSKLNSTLVLEQSQTYFEVQPWDDNDKNYDFQEYMDEFNKHGVYENHNTSSN